MMEVKMLWKDSYKACSSQEFLKNQRIKKGLNELGFDWPNMIFELAGKKYVIAKTRDFSFKLDIYTSINEFHRMFGSPFDGCGYFWEIEGKTYLQVFNEHGSPQNKTLESNLVDHDGNLFSGYGGPFKNIRDVIEYNGEVFLIAEPMDSDEKINKVYGPEGYMAINDLFYNVLAFRIDKDGGLLIKSRKHPDDSSFSYDMDGLSRAYHGIPFYRICRLFDTDSQKQLCLAQESAGSSLCLYDSSGRLVFDGKGKDASYFSDSESIFFYGGEAKLIVFDHEKKMYDLHYEGGKGIIEKIRSYGLFTQFYDTYLNIHKLSFPLRERKNISLIYLRTIDMIFSQFRDDPDRLNERFVSLNKEITDYSENSDENTVSMVSLISQ